MPRVVSVMSPGAVCLERKIFIPEAEVDDVTLACHRIFKKIGLKVMQDEKTAEGNTTVMAREGALVPLTMRTLLFPFSLQRFFKVAQRSGVHVVIAPAEQGVTIYSCGLALDERTGKPAEYASDEDIEEITDMMEAIDFESKFLLKIKEIFPKAKEVE